MISQWATLCESGPCRGTKCNEDIASVYAHSAIEVIETSSPDFAEDAFTLTTDEAKTNVTKDDVIIYTIKDVWDPAETTTEAEMNTTEVDDDAVPVYAYYAVDDNEFKIDTAEIIESAWVHACNAIDDDDVSDSSYLTSDEDEYDTTDAEDVNDGVEVTPAETTEGNLPFGFNIPNLGLIVNGQFQDRDYCFYITENSTIFETKDTDETLYLFFEGQNLEFVLYHGQEYHSFAALPSKVADLLITARVVLKH